MTCLFNGISLFPFTAATEGKWIPAFAGMTGEV
jgi:hypothetical protein